MIRPSRLADYAVSIMCEAASRQGTILSSRALSEYTDISESTVMKLLKLLAKKQLLFSSRGASGGYMIQKDPKDILILDIIAAIDGPIAVTLCNENNGNNCEFENKCLSKHGWNKVNKAIINTLGKFNLADFVRV